MLRSREKSHLPGIEPRIHPRSLSLYQLSYHEGELVKTVMTAVSNSSIRVLEISLQLMLIVHVVCNDKLFCVFKRKGASEAFPE
jgi:hypothetical protein